MTAGSIAAPVIVPLKIPLGAKRHESKHIVDQTTPIGITSDSKDTTLYYTINGEKPDPFQRTGRKYTYLYQNPFTLPASDRPITVRAVAISSDGHKQSNMVTKNFFVRLMPEASQNSSSNKMMTFSTATSSVMPASASSTGPQYLLNRFGPKIKSDTGSIPVGTSQPSVGKEPSLTVHAPSDYKTCVYCNAQRPDDLHAKFCPKCGKFLPFLPTSKPDVQPTIGLSVCGGCRAMVPVGSTVCVVCEAPIDPPPRLPVINAQLDKLDDIKGKPVCLACGTINGAEMKICVTCEKPLELKQDSKEEQSENRTSTPGNTFLRTTDQSGVYLLCSACGRINAPDARFCDWCGKKPSGPKQPVVCASCSATNSWESRHCVSCSTHLRPPSRHGMDVTSSMKIPVADLVNSDGWVPLLDTAEDGPVTCDVATQTEGIFYPSSRTISKAMAATEAVLTSWTVKKPQSGTYSPGRGYWRQQLDHICLHLKAYTQGCPDFQAAIGKPQMGKLLSATLHNENTELKVHLTYKLKPRDTTMLGQAVEGNDTKMLSAMLADSTSTILSEDSTVMDTTNTTIASQRTMSRRKKKRRKKKPMAKDGTTKLMEELSTQGDKDKVERLLTEEGADANATTPSGMPFLSLTALNGHHHCLQTLVTHGANINGQSKKTGNTALHEAILGGHGNLDCIRTLLNLGINVNIKNKAGLTACELAAEKRYDKMITCIASHKGASLLRKLCKPSPHDITL